MFSLIFPVLPSEAVAGTSCYVLWQRAACFRKCKTKAIGYVSYKDTTASENLSADITFSGIFSDFPSDGDIEAFVYYKV
jgi:hypothetical protein